MWQFSTNCHSRLTENVGRNSHKPASYHMCVCVSLRVRRVEYQQKLVPALLSSHGNLKTYSVFKAQLTASPDSQGVACSVRMGVLRTREEQRALPGHWHGSCKQSFARACKHQRMSKLQDAAKSIACASLGWFPWLLPGSEVQQKCGLWFLVTKNSTNETWWHLGWAPNLSSKTLSHA